MVRPYGGKVLNSGPSCGWQYSSFEAACGGTHVLLWLIHVVATMCSKTLISSLGRVLLHTVACEGKWQCTMANHSV